MLQSFWDYLRYAACDAILAGVEDAVRLLEQDRSPNDNVGPSSYLSERLKKAAQRKIADRSSQQPTGQSSPHAKSSTGETEGRSNSAAAPNQMPADQKGFVGHAGEAPTVDVVVDESEKRPVPSLTDSAAGHLRPPRQTASSHRQPHRGRPRENASR